MNILSIGIVTDKTDGSTEMWLRGQGALEYVIFLAVCSALVIFAAPYFARMREALDTGFAFAVERMLRP